MRSRPQCRIAITCAPGQQPWPELRPRAWRRFFGVLLLICTLPVASSYAAGQVGPAEISNARLRALEAAYLSQLVSTRETIAKLQFPFGFFLSRYVGLDPKQQIGADTRGLEFVLFHDRTVLKITGNYNAAFDSALLTQNQRAYRVFEEVVVPVLHIIPEHFKPSAGFDRVGFEISYHVRTHSRSYDYEGKEILVVVMDRADALGFPEVQTDSARQDILIASDVYLNGQEFGLALGARQQLSADELAMLRQARDQRAQAPAARAQLVPAVATSAAISAPGNSGALPDPGTLPAPVSAAIGKATASRNDAVASLQKKLQPRLDALGTEGMARYHFVAYAPPSVVLFRDQIQLQMTLRNPKAFDREATSIYKRAAQSFDLFLAPLLKSLLDLSPVAEEIAGLDVTVLSEFGVDIQSSPEAIEYIFPLPPLRKFTAAEITNQDLINQSIVLVNGVRIALDLQRVE